MTSLKVLFGTATSVALSLSFVPSKFCKTSCLKGVSSCLSGFMDHLQPALQHVDNRLTKTLYYY